ncbi:MAG: LexA family transcriptional regulator [Clostridia bacterium]|nr:LexA family transcriptional regulator [Clostridia bacterium]MBQ2192243.1 LexA family transcriptional regulator [Clostridia bacterium]MBQ3938498.1 LexA family transcriptional regulator [Clostridia bacterium]
MISDIDAKGTKKTDRKKTAEQADTSSASFGERLAALRKSRGLNQQQVADEVSRECAILLGREPITNRAVSKWETGDSLPDAQQFICLMRLYGVTDIQFAFRGTPSANDPFLGLNKLGRERANEYIGMLSENPYFSVRPAKERGFRQIPLYDLPASAGRGVFLDGESYTMIDADDSVPEAATFAVRISGDSMAPLFVDGQIVYVHQQPELESGDIGIFLLNGEAYCKKFDQENGVRLISVNPKYAPIVPEAFSDLRIVGRVVG